MKYLKRRPLPRLLEEDTHPLSELTNIFDITVVFCVGLLFILWGTLGLKEILQVEQGKAVRTGQLETLLKKARTTKIMKATNKELQGEGMRLGTAYMLQDGTVVYVPESEQ
jgi:hypothetical protein